MKKFINKVKGFTLTELAIVIAVIAILIAVLVPTFIALIDSANESNDVVTVKNLNTILSVSSDDIKTPSDALDIVAEEGYTVDKMTPTSEGEIVYNADSKQFIYIYEDDSVYPSSAESVDLTTSSIWYFARSEADIKANTSNSYFLAGDWSTSTASVETVQLAKSSVSSKKLTSTSTASLSTSGIFVYKGAGNLATTSTLSGITSVQAIYNGEANVTVIYNISVGVVFSCECEADDVAITVENYGSSGQTKVKGNITFKEYSESTSYDTSEITSGSVEIYNESFGEKVDSSLCNFGNTTVENKSSSTAVTTVIENIKSNSTGATTSFDSNGNVKVTINGITYTVGSDNEISTLAETITAATIGLGTEKYPYLIGNDSFDNFASDDFASTYFSASGSLYGGAGITTYFKLTEDITITSQISITKIQSNMVFDLNNKEIKMVYPDTDGYLLNFGNRTSGEVTIKNGTFKAVDENGNLCAAARVGLQFSACSKVTVENCDFYQVCISLASNSSTYVTEASFEGCNFTYTEGPIASQAIVSSPLLQTKGKTKTINLSNCVINANTSSDMISLSVSSTVSITLNNIKWYNTQENTCIVSTSSKTTVSVDSNCEFYSNYSDNSGTKVNVYGVEISA